jgi:hypothetical protein
MKLPMAWCIFVFAKYRLICAWNTVCINCLRFLTCDRDSHSTTHCMPTLTISYSEFWILYGSWYHGKFLIACCSFRGLFYGTGINLSKIEPIYREFFLEGQRNAVKCPIQVGWCPARDSKQKSFKCNFRVLQLRHPVRYVKDYDSEWYSCRNILLVL